MPDYNSLRELLQRRIAIISDTALRDRDPAEQLKQLQHASEAITQWHADHRGDIPAQLNHFLKQSSLSKALEYIDEL